MVNKLSFSLFSKTKTHDTEKLISFWERFNFNKMKCRLIQKMYSKGVYITIHKVYVTIFYPNRWETESLWPWHERASDQRWTTLLAHDSLPWLTMTAHSASLLRWRPSCDSTFDKSMCDRQTLPPSGQARQLRLKSHWLIWLLLCLLFLASRRRLLFSSPKCASTWRERVRQSWRSLASASRFASGILQAFSSLFVNFLYLFSWPTELLVPVESYP